MHSRDLSASFSHRLESRHFIFYYEETSTDVGTMRDVLEAFWDAVDRDFFPAQLSFRVNIFVLRDELSFQQFLYKEFNMHRTAGLFGTYIPRIRGLVTYEHSGYGTLTHELAHALLQNNFPHLPAWADEGVSSFFEKFYGYRDGSRMVFRFGFENPWRLKELGARLLYLDIRDILRFPESHDTSEKRMAAVFLYRHGNLRRYLELVKSGDKRGFNSLLEAAFDKPMADIQSLWAAYLKDVDQHRAELMRLPPSQIFPSRALFEGLIASFKSDTGGG
ncbi:MAG: hypothetical protein HGA80_02770 [Candidatus Omnitrophica bacterium]|nr:hypothetical protein [Candidatus Omnitrophota bacterium]